MGEGLKVESGIRNPESGIWKGVPNGILGTGNVIGFEMETEMLVF